MATFRTALHTAQWRQALQPVRIMVTGVALILLIGAFLAWHSLRPNVPDEILPGQTLAWEMAQAIGHAPGVQIASGAYLPGDTLLLYSRINEPDRTRVRDWAATQLEPFADRLASMNKGETLKWVIDFGAQTVEQEVIIAPLNRAADATLHNYVSATLGVFTSKVARTVASAPATQNAAAAVEAKGVSPGTQQVATQAVANPVVALPTPQRLMFENAADTDKDWLPLSGDWAASNGIYSQRNKVGYDYISILNLAPQTHYQIEARLRLVDGDMGGGFVYNAPRSDSRVGAQSVDMDKQGSFLRWGRYDAKGNYIYGGGGKLNPPVNDGQWHSLQLLTHATLSTVALDGRVIGQITNASPTGYLGLTTSQAHVDFDNVRVTILGPAENVPASTLAPLANVAPAVVITTAPPVTVATAPLSRTLIFTDAFANGNVNRWRVLNGAWQFVDQTYQQLSTAGTDLGSISTFQGENYTVTVRMRRLDGSMGAGLYFNMGQRDAKMHSQMINYTQGGKAVQWGHFDEGGNFVFEGIAAVPDGNDGQWHVLTASSVGGKATFTLDGKRIATNVPLTYPNGYVGLLVSTSKVAFDDIKIVTQ
ncbi:MAG: hypothetical protein U0350_49935 [Caldilineaceae bacterium]